ncbi:Ig-like domain-containing protein [[Eubacterium] cellulosolvens]
MRMDIGSLGAYMSENSSAYIDDMIFSNNNVTSTNNNGIYFFRFNQNAFENVDNSSLILGDFLVNYNNISSGADGIYQTTWTENGYNTNDNATAVFGNFEFNNNTINASSDGIFFNQIENWGENLFGYSEVTFGYFQVNDNAIVSGSSGIYTSNFNYIGYEMYGYSEFTMASIEFCRNTINASSGNGLFFSNEYIGCNMNDNSSFTLGNWFVNDNNITGSPNQGIYLNQFNYFGYSLNDNSSVVFSNFEFSRNWITTTGNGIYFDALYEFGSNMFDDSSFIMDDWLMNDNTIWSANYAVYLYPQYFGYTMYGNSQATYGTCLVSGNYLNSSSSYAFYNYWWYRFAYDIYENSSVTVGDCFINNNNLSSSGSRTLFAGPDHTAYNVYDNAAAKLGNYTISGNTIYSSGNYGIDLNYNYVGSNLEVDTYPTCTSTVVVGNFMIIDNDITSESSDGIYVEVDYCGYYLWDEASVTLGTFELCRNTIYATSGSGIYFNTAQYFGYDMHDDSSFVMGDWLINDNKIWSSDSSIYHESEYFGNNMWDNSHATIGKNEIIGNYCNSSNDYGISAWWWYDFGCYLYENASVTVGDCLVDNNNVTSTGLWSYGIYTGPYAGGADVYDNSSASFGDYIITNNQVRSNYIGMYIYYYEMGYYLQPDQYSACAGNVVVGDCIINNNEITSLNNDAMYLGFYENGYHIYNDSFVTLGNVDICNNTLNAPSGSGINFIDCYYWAVYMFDRASFSMGDWSINDNIVVANNYGFYLDSYNFGYEMYDNSAATFGTFELLRNDFNATNSNGLFCYWLYNMGYSLYENATVTMGNCIIKNNDIGSQNAEAVIIGPNEPGQNVYDNASAIFGDYVVSDNTVFSNSDLGIYFYYEGIGYNMQPNLHSTCTAYVELGDIKINNNDIITSNSDGIYFSGRNVGHTLYDNATVLSGNIQINDNTVHAYSYSVYVNYYRIGYNIYDNSSITLGTLEIDNNDLNSTDDDCLSLYISECFYDVNNIASFTHGDFFITNNILKNTSVGIEYKLINCGFVIDNARAYFGGLDVSGNTISASNDAIYYRTFQTPHTSSPNGIQYYGNITITNNDLDSGTSGAYVEWQHPDYDVAQPVFFLSDNDIHDGNVGSTGIYMLNIQNSYIEDVSIDNFDYGVYVNNSNITEMINSSISTIGILDLNLTSDSYIYTLNTTFNKASVVYEDTESLLEVAWYMHVQVNYETGDPAPFANLTVYDTYSTEIFNGKADANGRRYYLVCPDYMENITGEIDNFNDYSAFADDSGMFGSAIPNPTMDKTKLVVITLLDIFKPTLLNDSSDTFGTTGDPYHFYANITDNLEMNATRAVYWFGTGAPQNVTMNGTGPYWLNITAPLNSIDQMHYYFSADDAFDNWLRTPQVDVPIYDNDAPYNLVDNSDSAVFMAEDFEFEASAVDNIGVTEIHVVWWYDTGTITNTTMVGTGPYIHTLPIPVSGVDTLHYYFTVTDAAGNWITGPTVNLGIGDNVPPKIAIDSPANGTYVSGTIKLGLTASDVNSGLSYVAVWVVTESELYNSTPATSSFDVDFDTTTVSDGEYQIVAIAVDNRGMMNSTSIMLKVDNTPPTVNAGLDQNILVGDTVDFDGTACTDNTAIDTYNWSFTYDGKTQYLSGISPNFTFELEGDYTVTLTVTDVLGNFASDTMVVHVTKPVPPARPKVVSTTPANNAQDVNVSTSVTITFDIPMNTSSVESVLDISTNAIYTLTWNLDNDILTINFNQKLNYNTNYTITIGEAKATTGGILQNAPFILNFTTEKKPVTTPPNKKPKLTQGKVIPNKGTTETDFTFSVHYSDEDGDPPTTIQVWIDGGAHNMNLKSGEDAANGIYEYKTKLTEGVHKYYFTANDGKDDAISDDGTPIQSSDALSTPNVTKPTEKEEETDYTTLLLIFIIIIIIILLLIALIRRKKKAPMEEEEEEIEEEEEEETEEDEIEAEEFECPDCGASLGAGVTVCPECGAEFEEEELEEDIEDEELPEAEEPVEEEEPVVEEELEE